MYQAKIHKYMMKYPSGQTAGPYFDYFFKGRCSKKQLMTSYVFEKFMESNDLDLPNLLVDPNEILRENAIQYMKSFSKKRSKYVRRKQSSSSPS